MKRLFLLFILFYSSFSLADSGMVYCVRGAYGNVKQCALSGSELCSMVAPGTYYEKVDNWVANGSCTLPSRPEGWEKQVVTQPYSCAKDEFFDLTTFTCQKKPVPSCSEGAEKLWRSPSGKIVMVNGKALVVTQQPPSPACFASCEYTMTEHSKCYASSGSTTTGFCNYFMKGTGKKCEDETPENGDASTGDPLPQPPPENGGSGSGSGENGGSGSGENGGSGSGENGGSGSGENGGSGSGENGGSGSGENGGSGSGENGGSGSGGGSGGSSGGSGGSGGSGSGENGGSGSGGGSGGSGSGENGKCDPAKEECGKDEESSVSGMDCSQGVDCKGDAVTCAILVQQKEAWCKAKEFYDMSDKTVKKAQDDFANSLKGDDYKKPELKEGDTHDLTGIFNGVANSGGGGSCPVLPDIVYTVAGYTNSVSTTQAMTDFCSYLGFFGSIMVAFALFRGAQIVGEGMA